MKTCLFTLIFNRRSIHEALRYARDYGYAGVEIWGREPHLPPETTPERAREIKRIAADYGLTIAAIGAYSGGFSELSDEECRRQYEEVEKYLEVMDNLGCDLIRVACGGPHAFLAQTYHYEKAAYWLQKCADLAQTVGKRLAMEIHNGSLIETAEAAVKLLRMIDRDNVGVIYDAGNMYITDTDYGEAAVQKLGAKIFHVHVKDELRIDDETLPGSFRDLTRHGEELFQQKMLGEGAVDHFPLLKALKEQDYQGFLSNECHAAVPDVERAEHDLKELEKLLAKL